MAPITLRNTNFLSTEIRALAIAAIAFARPAACAFLNRSPESAYATHAKLMEQAGADATELNIYFITTDPAVRQTWE